MCGIFGLLESSSSGLFSTDAKIVWGMSLLTSMRGADATGFIGVDVKRNQSDYMKSVGGPWEWNTWKQSDEFMKRIVNRYNIVIGHGRAATIGKNVALNAHPFRHGDITLVHNGTLRNFQSLKTRHKLSFDVDSEVVCYLMNKIGLQETLNEIEGAFALAWWDSKTQTANFIRNSDRPLAYTISTNNRRLIFASESPTAAYGAFCHKTDKFKDIKEVPTFRHFQITCKGSYNAELEIVETNITKKYTSTPSTYTGRTTSHHAGYGAYWEEREYDHYSPTAYTSPTPKQTTSEQKVIICTGEDLEFELLDYDELETLQDGKKVVILRGKVPNSKSKVEVVCKYYKGPESLISFLEKKEAKPMFRGIVQEIRVLNLETFTSRIFLDKAVEVEEESVSEEQKTHTPNGLLELAQGKTMSFHQWSHLQPKGCAQCGTYLNIMRSNKMIRVQSVKEGNVLVDGIMCEICSAVHTTLEEAKNGEEKVALS